MKMKTTKTFDAVAMKRRGAKRIYEETAQLTPEQRRVYWDDANRRLEELQRAAQSRLSHQ